MGISLITKGIICSGAGGSVTVIQEYVLPLNVQLKTDIKKMTIKKQSSLKINIKKICG